MCERKREGPSDTPPTVRPPLVPSRRRLGRGHKYPSSPPPPTSHSSPSSTSPPTLAALAVLGHAFAHHWSWPQTLGARTQFRRELADPGPFSLSPAAAASRPTTLDPIILRGRRRRQRRRRRGNRKGEGNISKGISSSLTPLFLLPLISFARSFRPARDGGKNKGRMG